MVEAGVGLGIVPETTARRAARTMAIAAVDLEDPWAARDLTLCIRALPDLPPSARQLVEHLRKGRLIDLSPSPTSSAGIGRPRRRQAACRVLRSRQAMVIGPTPPGTGVMAEATSAASAKATSPTSRVLPSPAAGFGTRLMPTSITMAPGLIQSPRTISGRPTAATRMSARRQTSGEVARLRMGRR